MANGWGYRGCRFVSDAGSEDNMEQVKEKLKRLLFSAMLDKLISGVYWWPRGFKTLTSPGGVQAGIFVTI